MRAEHSGRTLVAVLAHPDDETPAGPVLARYAREGAQVYLIIASAGEEGGKAAGPGAAPGAAPGSSARGEDLARVRMEEARCAAATLGAQPPIFLGFPDGKLGDYIGDRSLVYRLTAQIAQELARLRPDALITWGPDGGTGHPDHRLVSDIVTQLVRAGAPGASERLYYMYIPVEGFRAMNAQRGEPPLLVPSAKYLNVRVPFTPADLDAAQRAIACHASQFTPEVIQRVFPAHARFWNGSVVFASGLASESGTDLFSEAGQLK